MSIDVEAYYRRYGPMVLRRCRQLLGGEEPAVDAMQDTFVQLLRHQSWLKDEAPSSLLYRIATNVCLNKLRSDRRRYHHTDDLLHRIVTATEPEPSILARLRLGRLFGGQKDSTQVIAVLHLLDGMTLEEVAREVGLSVSGVRKRLRGLRAQLEGV